MYLTKRWLSLFAITVVWFSSVNAAIAEKCDTLVVRDFSIEPNYPLTQDTDDALQLVDGIATKYPNWTKKNSVGWLNVSPVLIFIENKGKTAVSSSGSVLTLSVPVGERSGVFAPSRIDVYTKPRGKSNWKHVGFGQESGSFWVKDGLHKLPIKLISVVQDEVAIVIHSAQKIILLDEITLCDSLLNRDLNEKRTQPFLASKIKTSALIDHSTQSLKSFYVGQLNHFNKVKFNVSGDIKVTQRDCFSSRSTIGKIGSSITDIPQFGKFICIDFVSKIEKKIDLNSDIFSGISVSAIRRIHSVLSRDGSQYFDRLGDQSDTINLDLKPYDIQSVLVEIESVHSKNIGMHYNGQQIKFQTRPLQSVSLERKFFSSMWSYSDHILFKSDVDGVLDIQSEAGSFLSFIPPHHMPSLNDSSWGFKDTYPMISDINLFKKSDKIVMFVNMYPPKRHGWINFQENKKLSIREKKIIKNYINNLLMTNKRLGLEYSDWVLYLMDEINQDMYPYFYELVKFIKKIDGSIQIYANPVFAKSKTISFFQLQKLSPYVDYWQYDRRLATKMGAERLKKISDFYTIYSVPTYPTKGADPFHEYYLVPVVAWALGAEGGGFWSLTHTKQSVASDDFDSIEADWAALYESTSGVKKSMRYYAYLAGVDTYHRLSEMGARAFKSKDTVCIEKLMLLKKSISHNDRLTSNEFFKLFSKVLMSCEMST